MGHTHARPCSQHMQLARMLPGASLRHSSALVAGIDEDLRTAAGDQPWVSEHSRGGSPYQRCRAVEWHHWQVQPSAAIVHLNTVQRRS